MLVTTDTAELSSRIATKDQTAWNAAIHGTSAFAGLRTSPVFAELAKKIATDYSGLHSSTTLGRMRTSPVFAELAKKVATGYSGFSASSALAGIRASSALASAGPGADGPILGMKHGKHRPDLLILDDIEPPEEEP